MSGCRLSQLPVLLFGNYFCLAFKHFQGLKNSEVKFVGTVTMLLLIVKSLSRVRLFVTPRTEASQTSLSVINSRSSLKVKSTESVMPSDHLILCRPLLFTSVFPNIRIFSNQSALRSGWLKYWGFTFSISPSNEYSGLISFRINCFISFLSKGLSRVFFSNTIQNHQFSGYHEVISFTLGKVV